MKGKSGFFIICLTLLLFPLGCAQDKAVSKKGVQAKKDMGIALLQDSDLQGALKELLEAAEMDPTDAEIQNHIGYIYRELEEFGKAIIRFKRALELRPDFAEAQNNLGTVYIRLEEWDKALELFQKAAENTSYRTRQIAYTNLGYIYHREGEYGKAIENYEMALRLAPRHCPAYDNLGLAYEMIEEYDLAIDSYKKSIECSPDIALSHLRLARLYEKLGRHEEATKEIFETIRTDARGHYAKEARKLLEQIRGAGPQSVQ
jgi:Tfp pilus assembly protein PilF